MIGDFRIKAIAIVSHRTLFWVHCLLNVHEFLQMYKNSLIPLQFKMALSKGTFRYTDKYCRPRLDAAE